MMFSLEISGGLFSNISCWCEGWVPCFFVNTDKFVWDVSTGSKLQSGNQIRTSSGDTWDVVSAEQTACYCSGHDSIKTVKNCLHVTKWKSPFSTLKSDVIFFFTTQSCSFQMYYTVWWGTDPCSCQVVMCDILKNKFCGSYWLCPNKLFVCCL